MKYISKYNEYVRYLINIGIDPSLIEVSKVVDSAIKNNGNKLDFDTKNIIPGPFGELIKINYPDNQIEIYSIDEFISIIK